jgi:hypothetical protein
MVSEFKSFGGRSLGSGFQVALFLGGRWENGFGDKKTPKRERVNTDGVGYLAEKSPYFGKSHKHRSAIGLPSIWNSIKYCK